MVYTEYGLRISLDELKELVNRIENKYKYHNMESCIYISGGANKPESNNIVVMLNVIR